MTKFRMKRDMALYIGLMPFFLLALGTNTWADTIYTVKKGDSLYKISRKFKAAIGHIKDANGLDSNKLYPGEKLVIPSEDQSGNQNIREQSARMDGYEPPAAGESSAEKDPEIDAASVLSESNPEHPREQRTYTVRRGDTLWEISKRFSVSIKELIKFNNLSSGRLKPLQVLVLDPPVLEARSEPAVIPSGPPALRQDTDAGKETEVPENEDTGDSPLKDFLALVVNKTMGIPYKFGGTSLFMGIDCSAYVQKVLSYIGITLPRTAREQFRIGDSVDKKDLTIGDLVFFRTYAPFPSHVGIYIGNNLFVHASSIARKVTINSLNTPYYTNRFIGARRLPSIDQVSLTDYSTPLLFERQ